MSAVLTDIDRRVLDQLQRELPLVERPFEEIGRRIGLSEAEALDCIRALSGPAPAPIRQISAIFDSKKLGYQSCLVAAKVDPQDLEAAAGIINAHPGVSHNYQREHAYNLWFTLALPPDSQLGLEKTIELLQRLTCAESMRLMPALKLYKIGVKFDLGVESEAPVWQSSTARAPTTLSKPLIRALQQNLAIESRPFDALAEQAGVSVEELLGAARGYLDCGMMRRFSAVLRHREIGMSANAMGVWNVPPDQHDAFGELAAQNAAVSHCYLRPTYPDWPYSLFTMVHGKTRIDCERALAGISQASGIKDYTSLYSTHEFKKVRVKYFTGDVEQWEAVNAALSSPHGSRH